MLQRHFFTTGGSHFEGDPLPSPRLGSSFSRCTPAATNPKSMRNTTPPVRAHAGDITQAVFRNYRTLYVIPWCPYWPPFTTRGSILYGMGILYPATPGERYV